jgi:hypothetical protein
VRDTELSMPPQGWLLKKGGSGASQSSKEGGARSSPTAGAEAGRDSDAAELFGIDADAELTLSEVRHVPRHLSQKGHLTKTPRSTDKNAPRDRFTSFDSWRGTWGASSPRARWRRSAPS